LRHAQIKEPEISKHKIDRYLRREEVMKTIYRFLLLVLILLAVALVIVKVNNFSNRNEFYHFEQKCNKKRINLANYKQYEFKANDSLTQCAEKLILLKRCVGANYTKNMHDIMYKNSLLAFKKFPNFPPVVANYAFFQQLAKGDIAKSLPILLPFIQESANYPAIPESIYNILNDAYHSETFEEEMVEYLGDNDYETGRKKLKLLCDYWYSKLDAKYTNNSEKSLSIARSRMTIPKQQKAIASWKKLLTYINKPKQPYQKIAKTK
jgi:cell division protein FtsL